MASPLASNRAARSAACAAGVAGPPDPPSPWPELGDLVGLYAIVSVGFVCGEYGENERAPRLDTFPSLPPHTKVGALVRIRQHINPLKKELQVPLPPLDWGATFTNPALPLLLDVGCGSGRFALAVAAGPTARVNVLGLEIRDKLVDRARAWAAARDLSGRAAFEVANATVSLPAGTLASYPGLLTTVCVQFPDPHFKERHRKRRVVQPGMAAAAAAALAPGGHVFLQSDVLEVAESMRSVFEAAGGGVLSPAPEHGNAPAGGWRSWADAGWLAVNPVGVPTEREVHTLAQDLPVYRCLLVKAGGERLGLVG